MTHVKFLPFALLGLAGMAVVATTSATTVLNQPRKLAGQLQPLADRGQLVRLPVGSDMH